METTLTQLPPIPVEFVVGHALTKKSEILRRPYCELIQQWAEHEGREEEGRQAARRIAGSSLIDAEHMPKEFYQRYREQKTAEQLISLVQQLDERIRSKGEAWTWAHVMRVMIDEHILMAQVTVNRFDQIICSMIPGKGRDSVRKNGSYSIVDDRDECYFTWVTNSNINPVQASNHEICVQIAQFLSPILSRKLHVSV
jgi:hypothetical protein